MQLHSRMIRGVLSHSITWNCIRLHLEVSIMPRRKVVESLDELALPEEPLSETETALTTLMGGDPIFLDPNDGVMLVHWKADGEVNIRFPQLGVLSPGRVEQSVMKMYRQLMIARAGFDPAKVDDDESGVIVTPLDDELENEDGDGKPELE